jgi:hypothetical protein
MLVGISDVLRSAMGKLVISVTQKAEIWWVLVRSQLQANSSQGPILKIPNTRKGWWSDSRSSKCQVLRSKPSCTKKKKKKKRKKMKAKATERGKGRKFMVFRCEAVQVKVSQV